MLIKIENLFKSYQLPSGPVEVLKGASLSVDAGASVAVVGPSGSGKSTLLNLLAGLHQPDSGCIEIADRKLSELSPQEIDDFRSASIGIVFQHHQLLMQCTAIENVILPTLARQSDPEASYRRAGELLERVGLSHRADHFPAQLSGGEQHRVAIARALINRPSLLLADEPTGFLEPAQGREIIKLLVDSRDYTLITVTHADYVAQAMQSRYRLENGQLHKVD